KRVFLVILFTSFSGSLVSRIPGAVHKDLNVTFGGHDITAESTAGNDSNLLIVFYVQIMPDDFVMQLHR
ncbi:hypothetical protein OSK32_24455, partial [Escherichia coli]|nr:hypothetical protein [Escherichia coli]MDA6360495.1 hypothetical protein [Escherichia coli]